MFYCNECGQCSFINDDDFYENRNTWGWEKNSIDCNDGEYMDHIDSETTDSEQTSYECPHCCGEDIESDWSGSENEALEQRTAYEEYVRLNEQTIRLARERLHKEQKAKDPQREWDVTKNV